MTDLEFQVTGGLFLAAASMLWVGWTLLPAKIGAYFVPQDFAAVATRRRLWIWLYRLYLFGYVVAMMAFIALATLAAGSTGRIIVWPAVGVLSAGLIMSAVASLLLSLRRVGLDRHGGAGRRHDPRIRRFASCQH